MPKKATRFLMFGALVLLLVATLPGCEFLSALFAALYSVDGQVVDARSTEAIPEGVSGVSITLTAVAQNEKGATPTYTGTTDANGKFFIADIESGTYDLVASKDGWFIPPQTVNVSGLASGIEPIPAFELAPADAYGLSFILTWNESVDDLDIYLTFPTTDTWPDGSLATPYDDFGTNGGKVFWNDKEYYSTSLGYNVVYMDRDDRDGVGPETLTLVQIPHQTPTSAGFDTSSVNSINDANGLYAAFGPDAPSTLSWMGAAALYLDAYTTGSYLSSGEGSDSSDAVVYAIQTLPKDPANFNISNTGAYASTDMEASLLGVYRLPDYTQMKSASVLRVNMFRDSTADVGEWFQIVPDIRVIPDGTAGFLSTGNASPAIVGVRGR